VTAAMATNGSGFKYCIAGIIVFFAQLDNLHSICAVLVFFVFPEYCAILYRYRDKSICPAA
jgi:hypothetical protein